MVGGDQVAESHTANLKKKMRRNNTLSGLTLETAHVDGLSSLYVHSNLGLDCVLDAYASYMRKMLDQPNSKKHVWELAEATGALRPKMKKFATASPCKGCTGNLFFQKNGSPKISNDDAWLWNETM